ncbi:hypothetical protein [Mycobacterium sp. 3519A]|jgi:hypothetical protein|uniref:hypothetical protein n=1 Tax=Mycobacterium sp. 3519A TaxID=2057184 RepID=UPI00115A1D66|nr:hypothetical protein [Mycobacterium sp. 3519A]
MIELLRPSHKIAGSEGDCAPSRGAPRQQRRNCQGIVVARVCPRKQIINRLNRFAARIGSPDPLPSCDRIAKTLEAV